MIKRVILNRRTIPVPIPVRNLYECLEWLSHTLLKGEEAITRVILDDVIMDERLGDEKYLKSVGMHSDTKLEVLVDSPVELAVQTLDALQNIITIISKGLKTLAVHCWQLNAANSPLKDLDDLEADLVLVRDLCEHFLTLVDTSRLDTAHIVGLHQKIANAYLALQQARGKQDWQSYAKILLNQLEHTFSELGVEAAQCQGTLYSIMSEIALQGRTSFGVK